MKKPSLRKRTRPTVRNLRDAKDVAPGTETAYPISLLPKPAAVSRLQAHMPFSENALLLALGLAGAVLFFVLFSRVQPSARLDVDVGRGEAQTIAEAYLAERGYDLGAYTTRSTVFGVENRFATFLRVADVAPAERARLEAHEPPGHWSLLYISPDADDRVEIKVGTDGRIYSVERAPPDDLPGARLSRDEALERAQAFLSTTQEIDWAGYALINTQNVQRAGRTDYFFTWQQEDPAPSGARLHISATVQGGEIGGWSCSVELPQAFLEQYVARGAWTNFFQYAPAILVNALWILALVVFVLRFRDSEVSVRNAGIITALFALCFGAYLFNSLSFNRYAALAASAETPVAFTYLGLGINAFFTSLAVFMVWISGESLAREVWPAKLRTFDGLFARYAYFPELGRSVLRGFSLGFLSLGLWYVLVGGLVRYADAWPLVSDGEVRAFSSFLPFLAPALNGAFGALLATAYAPLFTLTFAKRRLKHTAAAVLVVLVVFEPFFHDLTVLRDRWPMAAAAMAVGIVTYVYFLRYNLFTVFVGLFVSNTAPLALMFALQPEGAFRATGALTLAGLALFLAYGWAASRRGLSLDERAIAPVYVRHIAERERLKMEMDIARRAQLRMLPRTVPRAKRLDIAALSEPAREVGGDYYDFVPLDGDRLGLAIGDVSGKGMPAALYMTMLKGFLQSHADTGAAPREVLSRINRKFYRTAEPNVFVTLLYGVIDLGKGTFTFARAGHHPVLVHRPSERTNYVLQPPGLGIGLEAGPVFDRTIRDECFRLQRGDAIVLYTDGLTEAHNGRREEFGEARVLELLKTHGANGSAEALLGRIREGYAAFVGHAEPHDDLTCVVVRVL